MVKRHLRKKNGLLSDQGLFQQQSLFKFSYLKMWAASRPVNLIAIKEISPFSNVRQATVN